MRPGLFLLALVLAACGQPTLAQAPEMAELSPQAKLSGHVREAIANHDRDMIFAHVKWDGVRGEHREIFRDFVSVLVEQPIEGVVLEPLGPGDEPFEHNGLTYAKNGNALGQVTIIFTMENPSESESLHWPYGIEDGEAVILLDAPVPGDAAG